LWKIRINIEGMHGPEAFAYCIWLAFNWKRFVFRGTVWDKIEGRAIFIRVLSFHPRFRRFLSCSHMWSVSFSEVVFGLGQEEGNSRTFSPELCVCLNLSQKLNNSTQTMRGREWKKKLYEHGSHNR